MFFVIPEMPSKTFVMLYKKLPDHFKLGHNYRLKVSNRKKNLYVLREAAIKKSYILSGPATKRGGGVKATKKKEHLYLTNKKRPLSSRGVGGKALVAGPLKKTFFAASLIRSGNLLSIDTGLCLSQLFILEHIKTIIMRLFQHRNR